MARITAQQKGKALSSKLCVKCGKVLPQSAFYPNKEWAGQSFHDAWCRKCAISFCTNQDTLKEYCYYNNRGYSNAQYDASMKKAMYALTNNAEYLKVVNTPAKKERLEVLAACRQFFSLMNLPNYYRYTNNITEDGAYLEYDESVSQSAMDPAARNEPLVFSREWNGMFAQHEIDYLNAYYSQLEDDFVLDNENIRDYARKVTKASLDADLTYNRMRHGQATVNAWKEAQAIFDNLSKSANFAACKRKPGDNAGLGALGLLVQKIEQNGELQDETIRFPEDDIDRIIRDFRHITTALGLDQLA